jgi:tetratricopeptide (TPR) repeat protein
MKRIRSSLTLFAAIFGAAGIVAAGAWSLGRADDHAAEYPSSPFVPMPADYPDLVPATESPPKADKAAVERYRAERKAVREHIRNHGSESGASSEEQAALDASADGKYVLARELAERILRSNPESTPARFVRAEAFSSADGNPAAALFELRAARGRLEALGRTAPTDVAVREWYFRVLEAEAEVLEQLGRDSEAILCVERMEEVYRPLPRLKIWPLMRLKRFDEAAAAIDALELAGGFPSHVANSRATLLGYLERHGEALEWSRRYATLAADTTTAWHNYGVQAERCLLLAEAEQHFLEATKHVGRYTTKSPHLSLASLYLQQSRLSEAAEALRRAVRDRGRRAPTVESGDRERTDRLLADLLLATGHLGDAQRVARRAYELPDQLGTSTATSADREFTVCFLLHAVLSSRLAELNERAVGGDDLTGIQVERAKLEAECRVLRSKILKSLDQARLDGAFVPYGPDSVGSDLLAILPRGVAAAALDAARSADRRPQAAPYFDAYAAELALLGGDDREANRLARAAIEALPADAEKALRCRLSVVAATAARRLGDTQQAVALLDGVLDAAPHLLRSLDASVPVAISDDGSPAARDLAAALRRSPRLVADPAGFPLRIATSGEGLRLEMRRLADAPYFETGFPIDNADPEAAVRSALERLHARLATPAFELDAAAIAALEGSVGGTHERDAIAPIVDKLRTKD